MHCLGRSLKVILSSAYVPSTEGFPHRATYRKDRTSKQRHTPRDKAPVQALTKLPNTARRKFCLDFFFSPVSESHRKKNKKQTTSLFLLSKPGRVSQPTGLAGAPWHGEQRARHRRSRRERKGTQRKGSSGAIGPPLCGQTQAHACTPALGHVHSHRHVVHLLLVWLGLFVSGLFSFSPVNPGLITVAFSLATCLENLTDVPAPPSCHSLADSSVRTGKEGLETSDVPRPY